jgi:microcystin-dependent protein
MGGTAANRLTVGNSGINGTDLGAYGGVPELNLSIAQLPAHDHPITSFLTSVNSGLGGSGSGSSLWYGGSSIAATAAVGSGDAVRVVQPTGILNYVIKY